MKIPIFPKARSTTPSILLATIMAMILVACGNSPSVVTQSVSPILASGEAQQPANTQSPVETPASVNTQAPVDTPAALTTPAPSSYSLTGVCPLVTKEEAESNLGSSVKDPIEQNFPPIFSCRYEDTEAIYFVDVTVVEFADAAQAEEVFQMAIDLNNYPQVSGIGDRAYQSEIYDITTQKGKYELSISVVTGEDKETRREKAKALAVSALERLP